MNTTKKWKVKEPNGKGLRHFYETLFKPARLATRHKQTVFQYDINLRRFDEYLGHPAKLSDLTDANVMGCVAWLQHDKGLSISSAEKLKDNLACIWEFLCKRGKVKRWPELPRIVVPKKIPVAWTESELKALWAFLSRMPGDVAGVPANLWFTSLLAVLWDSGERVNPVLTMKWSDVDLNTGYVIFRAAERKGGLEDKLSKLHPETVALLRSIVAPSREVVFDWPGHWTTLYNHWRDILRRCGLPTGRNRMFHCIRKSCASYTKLLGGNPSEVLGHADPALALQIYVDPKIAPRQQASDLLFRLSEEGVRHAG